MVIAPNSDSLESIQLLEDVLRDTIQLLSYKDVQGEELNIMTLHKSKGLEFEVVIHLDLYEKVLPYGARNVYKTTKYNDWIQDLNLHYVGVTRAKKACLFLNANFRTDNGCIVPTADSEFLGLNDVNKLRYIKNQ